MYADLIPSFVGVEKLFLDPQLKRNALEDQIVKICIISGSNEIHRNRKKPVSINIVEMANPLGQRETVIPYSR